MQLQVKVPKNIGLKQKILTKYSELYVEYRRFYPERKDYTYRQLRRNIAEVSSIVNKSIESNELKAATFIPWSDNTWKQFYYRHWYFAIEIEYQGNIPIAIIRDAHYEGDHHNDILLTNPYDTEDLSI